MSGLAAEGLDDLRLAELFECRKAPRAAMPALAGQLDATQPHP